MKYLFVVDGYKTINLLLRKSVDYHVKVCEASHGQNKVLLPNVSRTISSPNDIVKLSSEYKIISEVNYDEEVAKIETDPIYRKHFLNLMGVQNDETVNIGNKQDLLKVARETKLVIKSGNQTYCPKSAYTLVELAELLGSFVVAKKINGIKLRVYYNAFNDDAFFTLNYKDGYVQYGSEIKDSKIFQGTISKFKPFLLNYAERMSNLFGSMGEDTAYLRFDLIVNTGGVYIVSIKNGIDDYWANREVLDRPKSPIKFFRVFITSHNPSIIFPNKITNVFYDKDCVFADFVYVNKSFYTTEPKNIAIHDDFLSFLCVGDFEKAADYDEKWLRGQGFLKKT